MPFSGSCTNLLIAASAAFRPASPRATGPYVCRSRTYTCGSLSGILRALVLAVAVLLSLADPVAAAGDYTRLQVLLPGESPAPGTNTGKMGIPRDQTAGVPFDVRVRACDAQWNTVATVSHIVELGSSDQEAVLPPPAALVSGEHVFTATLAAGGSFTFSATDQTDPSIPDATSAAITVLVLRGFEFSRINQKNQYAGVPMRIDLAAVDGAGRIVTGFSGPVHLREITSFGEGRISPEVITLAGGTWSGEVTNYRADETNINRGNVNMVATLDAEPSRNGSSDPFVVHPGIFDRVQLIVAGQTPAPGSVTGTTGWPATQGSGQPFYVEVYATDPFWNPLPSIDVVRLSSSDPQAALPAAAPLENGYRRFTVSLGTVGTETITVTDWTNGGIRAMTSPGIPVLPSAPDHFVIEPFPSPVSAGDSIEVTIRATDVHDNTIPEYSGNAMLYANTGPGSVSPEAIVFSNGIWAGRVLFRGAGGSVSLSCSDFAAPPHTGTSAGFVVLPGPLASLQVLLPGQTPLGGTEAGFSGTPDAQSAGSSFGLRVRAVDAWANLVPGVEHRISLASSDSFATAPAETLLVNGEVLVPVILYKAGFQTWTATDLDAPEVGSHVSQPVEVLAGPYARVLILAPGEEIAHGTESGRTGHATDQSINFAFKVSVRGTDAWWNPVTGVTDRVHLTSTDPMAQLPSDAPMVDGRVDLDVRLATGGYQQITASNADRPEMPSSTTQVRAISSGFHLEATVEPSEVSAGEPFTLRVRVTNDAGSTIQEINSFVDIEIKNASTQEPGRGTLLTTRFQLLQGERAVQETYTFTETIVLIARDDAGNAPAVTGPIAVSPGAPAAVALASDPAWVGGNKHATVTARVVDAFGNGVPARPVAFVLVQGAGVLTAIDDSTDAEGAARADFLSPRQPETGRVRAASDGLSADLDIETALVDPDAPGGTLTSYPNPIHPDEAPGTILYKLADNATVTLRLYTLSGGLVLRREFAAGSLGGRAGLNEVVWDGKDDTGGPAASGGYILDVKAQGTGETLHHMRRKIAVVR